MICKGQSVTQAFTFINGAIEIKSTYNGETLTATRSLSELEDDMLYFENQAGTAGNLFDFNKCHAAEYRKTSGIAGPAGIRVLRETIKSCICTK